MESNRIWHDPVVEIFSNLVTPGVCCSAEAYDLANRRWYRLEVDAEVLDEDWLSSTVAKHVRESYAANKEVPPWNTIKTTARGSPVTFETKPDDRVDRLITKSLSYGSEATNKLPTTTFDQLESLTYISRSADRCTWHGKDCVFKRIEFNVDIKPIMKEIRIRETLIDAIGPVGIADVNAEITRRFLVVPVLAVVIGNLKPWKPGTVAGVLMLFAGPDLEILARDADVALPITERQLRDLVRGVRDLGKCGVEHGDIKYWNTVLQPAEEDDAAAAAKLLLIDLGSVAPEYDGDAKALGALLLWCLERAPTLKENEAARARVDAAAAALAEEDFDAALESLSPGDA
ncbi:hypothetical protein QBC33DRAFT_355901 [Phialemonium atrogriseum]|uniref:Protein kinase domain-containing protein n=1 Tax=Phialemonium atrogriseum TaxID=1093897 RepID=A0AAJ0FQ12_9PEZI|nr:uncharacterized protein QBC33DRAFT_355901 [Phialemonium atrogriseum]KAK1768690.1 hypothetical protein QBC33DRAFT_355901 [Phialemonium atrogriseum]